MQERLPLTLAAGQFPGLAVALNLPDVAPDRLPAPDLATVFVRHAAAHVIAAVPLEPAARIVWMKPALIAPDRQRLAGVDAEKIERTIAASRRELGAREPALAGTRRGNRSCICRRTPRARASPRGVSSGRNSGSKLRPAGARELIAVAVLHLVAHRDGACRATSAGRRCCLRLGALSIVAKPIRGLGAA